MDNSDPLLGLATLALSVLLTVLGRYRGLIDFRQLLSPAQPPKSGSANGNGTSGANGNGQYTELRVGMARLDAADKLHEERDSRYHELRDDLKFFKQDYLLWKEQSATRHRQIDERFGTMQRMLNELAEETRPIIAALPEFRQMLTDALNRKQS